MATELKPCPFCGGKAFIDVYMIPKEEYRIRCLYCPTRFGRYAGFNKKEAIEAWNRRAAKTPCDLCKFNPPSSMDGKPCTMCVADGRAEDGK